MGGVAHRQFSTKRVENVFTSVDTQAADKMRVEAAAALDQRLKKRKIRILQAAREQGRITNDGVEDLFCISDRTASKYLHQLTQAGELTRHGAGRGTYYLPT